MTNIFDLSTLRSLSKIIGEEILSHKEINEQFQNSGIVDTGEGTNKPDRIYYNLKARQKQDRCANNTLNFITRIINPKRYDNEEKFEKHRAAINEKLLYEKAFLFHLKGESFPTVPKAIEAAISNAKENDLIFVGGSTFVVAEVV